MNETWKDITDYEGLYQISNCGRVKSLKRAVKHKAGGYAVRQEKIITPVKRKNGYLRVQIYSGGRIYESVSVHKLVAMMFIDNPENKPFINHKNGVKTDNRIENLEWCTCSENHKHAFEIGLKNQKGEKNNASKLTESDVVKIKSLLKTKISKAGIARMFNVCDATIINISKEKVWSHIKLKTA